VQVVFTVLSGILIAGIHYGIGMHNDALTAENITQALKVLPKTSSFCGLILLTSNSIKPWPNFFYIANTATIKLSVEFLWTRISLIVMLAYKYIIYSSMLIFTVSAVITLFCGTLSMPSSVFRLDKIYGTGTCINLEVIANFGYAFSAINIFFDCCSLCYLCQCYGVYR
jgi:hypothetical protein